MREIQFNELKLKDNNKEENFYEFYLQNLQDNIEEKESFTNPEKKYEICFLNILEGKIVLLNKNYINSKDNSKQELFYDYSIAYKIYNLMLDIEDGIEAEKYEFNELYKNERLEKRKQIEELKKQDEEIFKKKQEEYNIIINSTIYKEYIKLKEENEKLKNENKMLIEEISNKPIPIKEIGWFQKLTNIFKHRT